MDWSKEKRLRNSFFSNKCENTTFSANISNAPIIRNVNKTESNQEQKDTDKKISLNNRPKPII